MGTARIGEVTGATTTGMFVVSPAAVVTGAEPLEAIGSLAGTISVGCKTAVVGTTFAGTVKPGSETVTVAPKNPPETETGGT